jgi:arsenate reductase
MLNARTCVKTVSRSCGLVLTTTVCLMAINGVGTVGAADDKPFQKNSGSRDKPPTVLFLCPHGAAKSVLASAYFQQVAKERGLNVRVEAAGTDPQDQVSPVVTDHLRRNGYPVTVTKPRKVTHTDIETADVVISMGCDLTGLPVRDGNVQRWDEIPGPSEDFKRADEAIRRRVTALVEELLARQKK